MPGPLSDALRDIDGAMTAVDHMPVEYLRRAYLFIEQSGNPSTERVRVGNFVEVVRFFVQDSGRQNRG
jgi:hypothetical protein